MKTIDFGVVKGYAPVAVRIKEFREHNPRGKIITRDTQTEEGMVKFKAYIWKDRGDYVKDDLESADSTGTALNSTKDKKAFEKLETVAIGRALSILGYMVSGEVASDEEMEMFIDKASKYDQIELEEKIEKTKVDMKKAKTIDELKLIYIKADLMSVEEIVTLKDDIKDKLAKKEKKVETS